MRGCVGLQKVFPGRLQMRVAGPAPPHVDMRIVPFAADLVEDLSCAPAFHGDLKAGFGLEGRFHGRAPVFVNAAQDVQVLRRSSIERGTQPYGRTRCEWRDKSHVSSQAEAAPRLLTTMAEAPVTATGVWLPLFRRKRKRVTIVTSLTNVTNT